MEKRRIAFVVAVPGTASAFLINHFTRLLLDYNVNLVANFPNEESKVQFQKMGVRCYSVPILRSISIFSDIKALFVLVCLFKREKFDCVHSVTPKAGLLSSLAGKMAGISIRIHIFTGQVWATKTGVMRLLLKFIDKLTAYLVNYVLVDGESQRNFLIKEDIISNENSGVLANGSICGVNLDVFKFSKVVRQNERRKFGFNEDDVVYIFMGRLNHDKGIGELYQAFDFMVKDCPNAKLVFYGDDEEGYKNKIDKYQNIKRDINFFYPGTTTRPFESLQVGDVFVLPTWREGFGSSIIEAQALGLPVITSNVYGVLDASIEGKTGLRCNVNDSDGLYQLMTYYYHHKEIRKLHGEAGRRYVIEKFSCNLVTNAWADFYHQIFL